MTDWLIFGEFWTQLDSKKRSRRSAKPTRPKRRKRVGDGFCKRRHEKKLTEGKDFLDSKRRFFVKKLLTNKESESSMRSIFDASCRLRRGN